MTTKRKEKKEPEGPKAGDSGITGTYRYDARLGRVVKVSNRTPKVASKGKGAFDSAPETGPCGRTACAGGSCAGMDGLQ